MKKNEELISILEDNGFKLIQFCEQDNSENDVLVFVNKHTNRVNDLDCIRVIQLLKKEGYETSYCNTRIYIGDGIVEDPVGEVIFYHH